MQNQLSQFFARIGQKLTAPVFSGYGGFGGWRWLDSLSRGGFDYRKEAGNLWDSSIPLACLKWEQRATSEVEIITQKRDAAGDWVNDPTHPVFPLISNPNDFFDTHQLFNALKMDYHLDGNAYLWKSRSASGQVVQLWWMPHWLIEPCWQEDGQDFISCYQYRVNGKEYSLPVEDVIHFRNGIDPISQGRKGLSEFHAALREVCTDNEAGVFSASMLRNRGIPGVIISPKGAAAGGNPKLTKEQRKDFTEHWNENFTGENRGAPFVQSIPVDITIPAFTPQQLLMDSVRQVPEARISAAFGIPPAVLGLGIGLAHTSRAAAAFEAARAQAYDSCVMPCLHEFARTLTRSLMPEFGDVINERIFFDTSNVGALQDDQDALFIRLSGAYDSGWLKRSEVREKAGYQSDPSDDVYAEPKTLPFIGTDPANPKGNTKPAPNGEEEEEEDDDDDKKALKTMRREIVERWDRALKAGQ